MVSLRLFQKKVVASLLLSAVSAVSQTVVWAPGVTTRIYDIQESMDRFYDLVPNQTPNVDILREAVDFGNGAFIDPTIGQPFQDYFVVKIFGQIEVPIAGTYEFAIQSDDGSLFYLDDEPLIDNDGTHGPETVTASVTLGAGWVDFHIDAFNDVGDFLLKLYWKKPGDTSFTIIPQSSLRADNNTVRVIAPGKKFILNNGDLRPGTGLPVSGLHPAWELETIRPSWFKPQVGAMTLVDDDTLFLGTFIPNQQDDSGFNPESRIWRVDNVDGSPSNVTVTQVAGSDLVGSAQFDEITGMEWVDGSLFIAERTGIFRLLDANEDGLFESKERIGDTWAWNSFHQFPFCLKHRREEDGDYLYGSISVGISLGGLSEPNEGDYNGSAYRLKIPPRGARPNEIEYLAGGFRTPNGVNFGPDGDLFVTDNQGSWNPANSLTHVVPNRFYGHYNPTDSYPPPPFEPRPGRFEGQTVSPKSVYLPQNEICNSPTEFVMLEQGDFAGQLLMGELTAGGLRRVFLEKVKGEWQGCVFRHSQGFEAGINRIRQAADGSLYLGGMGSNGSWSFLEMTHGLQRMRPKSNAPEVFEIKSVKALKTGIAVEFTQPVPVLVLDNPASYFVQQWRYKATESYGGPKIDLTNLDVAGTSISEDRKVVYLDLPGMLPGHVIYLRTGLRSESAQDLWSGEAWYTMNQIPDADPTLGKGHWRNLLENDSLAGWRAFKGGVLPQRWSVANGVLTLDPEKPGDITDIVTKEAFSDFELELEWKVPPDGNSGIFIRLDETPNQIWEGGLEMQIVDDVLNADGTNPLYRAGSIYALYPVPQSLAPAAETWMSVRIIADGPELQYYLNDTLTASFNVDESDYWDRIQNSKYNYLPNFGRFPNGPIGFQDYNNFVQFRNIRIRPLSVIVGGGGGAGGAAGGGAGVTTRLELEAGTPREGAGVADDVPAFSGTGFIAGWDNLESNEKVDISYEAPADGSYALRLRYGRGRWSGIGELTSDGLVDLLIDGNYGGTFTLQTTEKWGEWRTAGPLKLNLSAGTHLLTLRNPFRSPTDKKQGVGNFDYLDITSPDATGSGGGREQPALTLNLTLDVDRAYFSCPTENGASYDLQKSNNLTQWETHVSFTGDGETHDMNFTLRELGEKTFYRVKKN